MAGTRKTPKLRLKDGCFVANIYKPDGKRSTISFGSVGDRTEGDIYAAFGKWLNLFSQHPHKVLTFKNPYEAISQIINPQDIVTVGELLDKYTEVIGQHASDRSCGRPHPDLERLNRLGIFLEPYREWPVGGFGADELYAVQNAMVEYQYDRGDGNPSTYTRSGINKVISYIHRMWQWGIGREITTEAQKQLLKEVRPLRAGQTTATDRPKRALVTKDEFEKVAQHATAVVADMLRLIWLTAMRQISPGRMAVSQMSLNMSATTIVACCATFSNSSLVTRARLVLSLAVVCPIRRGFTSFSSCFWASVAISRPIPHCQTR
jgi:hypothetical protein